MTELENAILTCAKALEAATRDEVESATWDLSDDQMTDGEPLEAILDGIRFAKRMQVRTDAGGTILHLAWADGVAMTLEAEGEVSMQELLKDLMTDNTERKQDEDR